jgi:hypothetical protein
MTDDEYRPFVVERPGENGRIKLAPEAKYWAEQHGMTLQEMARYLLQQHEAQRQEDRVLSGGLSENIEDRREESFVPDKTQQQIWGPMANVPPQVTAYGPNPLANQLGFRDIGQRAPPAPQILGPLQPSWPAAFGSYQHDVPLPFD